MNQPILVLFSLWNLVSAVPPHPPLTITEDLSHDHRLNISHIDSNDSLTIDTGLSFCSKIVINGQLIENCTPGGGGEQNGTQPELPDCQLPLFPPVKVPPADVKTELGRRRQFIVNMARECWTGYAQYAWGEDQLRPEGRKGFSEGSPSGATIASALDTLWLMDLKEQFQAAADWVLNQLSSNKVTEQKLTDVYGALLGTYSLTGNRAFLDKAQALATHYIRPSIWSRDLWTALYNSWRDRRLEFGYLSGLTRDWKPLEEMLLAYASLSYPTYTMKNDFLETLGGFLLMKAKTISQNPKRLTIQADRLDVSIGFLKMYGKIWNSTASPGGITFVVGQTGSRFNTTTRICATYASTMTLLARLEPNNIQYLSWGKGLGNLCHLAATNHSRTGLPPVSFLVDPKTLQIESGNDHDLADYSLAEAYFLLWRTTGDPIWRHRAWLYAQALYTHTRTPGTGYSSIRAGKSVDLQPNQFLGATLKYLYLTFAPEELLPLNQWVFTREGHPLPVYGLNAAFPEAEPCKAPLNSEQAKAITVITEGEVELQFPVDSEGVKVNIEF